jgi:DnaJ-class molecular chaperone
MTLPQLERPCRQCNGLGVVHDDKRPDPQASTTCPACGGRGAVPTDEGRQLLEFLRKHLR